MRSKKRLYISLILPLLLFLGLLGFSGTMIVTELVTANREAEAFERLADQVRANRELLANGDLPKLPPKTEETGGEPAAEVATEVEEEEPVNEAFLVYASLYQQNPDFFGWLSLEGTEIDYPIMFTPTEPQRYLRRAFDGSYALSGCPFLDGGYFDGCYNYLIYGHNMKNGKIFASMTYYADEAYWREHPTIRFDTLNELGEYEIMAAFYSEAYPKDEVDVFRYYQYVDLSDPERYAEYLEEVEKAALYDTGVAASYGDQLLTLSTCSYHSANGRFVIVAKKIES